MAGQPLGEAVLVLGAPGLESKKRGFQSCSLSISRSILLCAVAMGPPGITSRLALDGQTARPVAGGGICSRAVLATVFTSTLTALGVGILVCELL